MDGRVAQDEENKRFDWPVVPSFGANGRASNAPFLLLGDWLVVGCKRKDWPTARVGTLAKGREQGAG